MRRLGRTACSITALVLACLSCSSEPDGTSNPATPSNPSAQPIRVLILTATAGFRHDSIGAARQSLSSLAASSGAFTVNATEDLSAVNASTLANTDVLFFALTSGELAFTADQKSAILNFVSQGGGFLGAHSATDTLYDLASLTLGHEEHLADVVAGYGSAVDLDVIYAWWSLQSLRAARWLIEHGFDPSSPGAEFDFLRSAL